MHAMLEGRPLREFWHFGNMTETCLSNDEALAICGLIHDTQARQYWEAAKTNSATVDMQKLAHKHAMNYVRTHGLQASLEAAWKYWESPMRPTTVPALTQGTVVSVTHSVYVGNADALFSLMASVSAELKEPGILFKAEGHTFVLVRFGDGTQYIQLFEGRKALQRGLLGALQPSGTLLLTHQRPLAQEVMTALRQFLSDPVGTAIAYGKEFGECSFCGRKLTDSRSIEVGYGPVCATNFGLPWGEGEAFG